MLDQITRNKKVKVSKSKRGPWKVEVSSTAKNTRNFIREIVDNIKIEPNPQKQLISLSIGDPTVYGNLKTSNETIEAVIKAAREGAFNGYAPAVGYQNARQAVAEYLSFDGAEYSYEDVILCSGCSSSLEMCITVLADPLKGQNILVPRPGFPIYRTLAESIGVKVKYYDLIPEKDWEIDLDHLESLIDYKTAAIVLNNPSNPCGSVYSEDHLRKLLAIAYNYQIPIIADEIYDRLVFPGHKFVSLASLNSYVPILVCGGLAKRFLVPGWRLGWVAIHDPIGAFDHGVRQGMVKLSQRTIGSNTLIQGAIPSILKASPQKFFDGLIDTLVENAKICYEILKTAKGIIPYRPQGTMYMMVEIELEKFPEFKDGMTFGQKMIEEESVFCLPGECFEIPGFMRLVLTVPQNLMEEACDRIVDFCNRHYLLS
ncbi:tyrosine aminotransferase [Coccinella septempunctata]|uniref:tyrosine aminotransferase n=1 Tax=Coccinella septempunctata TaxID=41139 RepID=UPI001D07ED44|nr:tyrosine aminotransferase [Coccinella septempunctata]